MFGISLTEFLVIILVAICVVPAKYWPDVARVFVRIVRYLRDLIWKVTDVSEQIQQRIDLERPIDDLIQNAANDMFEKSEKIVKRKNVKKK